MILAKTAIEFSVQPGGLIHIVQDGVDLARGPVGVLFYLALVVPFWITPQRWRALYLTASSLLLALVTVGHAFTATIAVLAVVGFVLIRTMATARGYMPAVTVLIAGYAALLLWPQPYWLPAVADPLYFYLHWAGIGYMFLRTLHVLNDRVNHRIGPPAFSDWLAYILFAPCLRMGPIYRYDDFHEQLHGNLAADRQLGAAAARIVGGLFRLGLLGVLVHRFPLNRFFNEPETFSTAEFLLCIYLTPMSIYLWISGYVDLAVGIGRAMGMRVPENFNYPWLSLNLPEFWRRWHITLGLWLKDYIYKPLRRREWSFGWAVMATFVFCGIWHAPLWCYILWGASQGVGMVICRVWQQFWQRQRAEQTQLFTCVLGLRLVDTPVSTLLAWLVTYNYVIATIVMVMDIDHAGRLVGLHFCRLMAGLIPG